MANKRKGRSSWTLSRDQVNSMTRFSFGLKSLTLAAVLVPIAAIAQSESDFGQSGLSDPWEELSLNSKARLKMNFRNANVDNVIAFIEEASGITVVKDPTLVGPITVTTSKPVSLAEAFYVFDSVLRLRGFEISRQRKILAIKAIPN